MKCPLCGHLPHEGWACDVPESPPDWHTCECPYDSVRQTSIFDTPDPLPSFDGKTYVESRDGDRLRSQYERVWRAMVDGQWHTLAYLSSSTDGSEPAVSARLRDFRKPKFGGHTVERRYVADGVWEYRLLPRQKEEV